MKSISVITILILILLFITDLRLPTYCIMTSYILLSMHLVIWLPLRTGFSCLVQFLVCPNVLVISFCFFRWSPAPHQFLDLALCRPLLNTRFLMFYPFLMYSCASLRTIKLRSTISYSMITSSFAKLKVLVSNTHAFTVSFSTDAMFDPRIF